MRKAIIIIALVVFSVMAGPEPLRVAGGIIEGLVDPFEQGSYSEIIKRLNQHHGASIEQKTYPFARVRKMFDQHQLDCVFPAEKGIYWGTEPVFESDPIQVVRAYLFSRRNAEPYRSLSELKGKWISIREDTVIPPRMDIAGINFEKTANLEAGIRRLLGGKVDAIIAYDVDAAHTFAHFGIPPLNYAPDAPMWTHNDGLLCHESAQNRRHITVFNQGLAALKADGTLSQLLLAKPD